MSVKREVTRQVVYEATCDQCGLVDTWSEPAEARAEFLNPGYEMARPYPQLRDEDRLWFDTAECVHKWVETHVILRALGEVVA